MDFAFNPEQNAWRQEIRQFLKENPKENFPVQSGDLGYGYGAWSNEFGQLLGSKGWISMTWPKEYGGSERPLMDLLILMEELAYSQAPWHSVSQNFTMGNMVIDIGSDLLKKELLPGIARGEERFWLAMSEPEAGSDLLSLKTRAVEEDNHFLVNGQKVWSSLAERGRYGLLYARTEFDPAAKRSQTISLFLLDKDLPGITVRPMINLAGEAHHNEVFLDDVRIPREYLLGQKNQGLPQMLKTLDYDRFWARFIKPPFCKSVLEQLVQYARETRRDGVNLSEDPLVRHSLAESAIAIEACRMISWNAGWKMCNGLPFSHEGTLGKVMADEMGQRLFSKGMEIMGPYSQLEEGSRWTPLKAQIQRWYLSSLGHTLAGGTSEIIRNTIATIGLGLPRS